MKHAEQKVPGHFGPDPLANPPYSGSSPLALKIGLAGRRGQRLDQRPRRFGFLALAVTPAE